MKAFIEQEIKRNLQVNELDSMVFVANTSYKFLEFSKQDEQMQYGELIEKYNFWECFESSELRLIFKSKSIEIQWKILCELNQIDLNSDEFVDNFSCPCLFERRGVKEVGRLLISTDFILYLFDLNGFEISSLECKRIDSFSKKNIIRKEVMAEICLRGEETFRNFPLFIASFQDSIDLEKTLRKCKVLSEQDPESLNPSTIRRRRAFRNNSVMHGIQYNMSGNDVEEFKKDVINSDASDIQWPSHTLKQSRFKAIGLDKTNYIIEFRVALKDINIFIEEKSSSEFEILFNDLQEWNISDSFSYIVFKYNGKYRSFHFILPKRENINSITNEAVKSFKASFTHFLDLCHLQWIPKLPLDESRNLRFIVTVDNHPWIMTYIKETKELILREEKTANFYNHNLKNIAPFEWFHPRDIIIKNLKTGVRTKVRFRNVREKLLAETVIMRYKV